MLNPKPVRFRVLCLLALIGLTATACSGTRPSPYHSGNYPGELKIGKPYQVEGRTYVPGVDTKYDEVGVASWYGPGFHGRSTANGERFDQNALTAAHRTLPMPSMVLVTNLENGKTVKLKVNDRGPFKSDRILDLSKRAAEELGVIATGTARVRVQYLPDDTKQMVANLLKTNKLRADEQTLAALGMQGYQDNRAPQPIENRIASEQPKDNGSGRTVSSLFIRDAYAGDENAPPPLPVPPVETVAVAQPASPRGVMSSAPVAPVETQVLPGSAEPLSPPPATDAIAATSPHTLGVVPTAPPPEPIPPPTRMAYQEVPAYRAQEPPAGISANNGYFVQAGSFSKPQNAHTLAEKLASLGQASVVPVVVQGQTWYRVRLGPISDAGSARTTQQRVVNMGVPDARVVQE